MAYFAKLDENNIVVDVNVVNDIDVQNLSFPESEPIGILFLTKWSGGYNNWRQTSETGSYRANYANIGSTYDSALDVFIPAQPYPSWTLDMTAYKWQPPVSYPNDNKPYIWDENTQTWLPA